MHFFMIHFFCLYSHGNQTSIHNLTAMDEMDERKVRVLRKEVSLQECDT